MDNLIFSLNATVPIFLLMMFGLFFRKIHFFDDAFVAKTNKFVFSVSLPALLFHDLSTADFYSVWDGHLVLFCFLITLISISISFIVSLLLKDHSIRGEFIQASYRSSAALLGIAFIQNIYGSAGMAPLMIIGTVPLYNVVAVIVLSVMKPERSVLDRKLILQTLKGILTNPIILGIVIGTLWSLLKLPLPAILNKTIINFANLATPLGLMAMGASFDASQARNCLKPAIVCSFLKLIGYTSLFLPFAIYFGFRQDKLISILVMLGSATTVSCFIMAKNMGHKGILTTNTVLITTLFSSVTLTFWLFLLKSMNFV